MAAGFVNVVENYAIIIAAYDLLSCLIYFDTREEAGNSLCGVTLCCLIKK